MKKSFLFLCSFIFLIQGIFASENVKSKEEVELPENDFTIIKTVDYFYDSINVEHSYFKYTGAKSYEDKEHHSFILDVKINNASLCFSVYVVGLDLIALDKLSFFDPKSKEKINLETVDFSYTNQNDIYIERLIAKTNDLQKIEKLMDCEDLKIVFGASNKSDKFFMFDRGAAKALKELIHYEDYPDKIVESEVEH